MKKKYVNEEREDINLRKGRNNDRKKKKSNGKSKEGMKRMKVKWK